MCANTASARWVTAFEQYAQQVLAGKQSAGPALSAVVHGETVYELGRGDWDPEQGLPVTPDTVFGIASISKPFTALAVLQERAESE
jgi:CubicO group peptidase (beta-lactamase class C family)